MKIKEIAFVCYAVTDLQKARAFYEGVLNLTPGSVWEAEDKKTGFVEYEMGPHTLAIGAGSDNFKPSREGVTAALEVEDFKEALKELKAANVKFTMESHESPVCWMSLFEDPDGNKIMLHKRKAK
jgi:predicted enzyme related to lactoylglutathione lyase